MLKKNKAAGHDRISAEILKAIPEKLLLVILKLMNKIKNTCHYPQNWAIGITSLLLKDGDDEDPDNYRAITVTNCLAKVLATLINERLDEWCTKNSIICKEQIGFEKKSRPADHLFVLKTLVDSYNSKNKKIYACFVDFRKAFDCVWRTGLFFKLIKSNMSLNFIKLIQNMYKKTNNSLKVANGLGRSFNTHRGVQQGCILSPRLFNIFLNDLPSLFDESCHPLSLGDRKLNCLMYADDLVMLSETPQGLQSCLDKLKSYTVEWGLEINKNKTKILTFQRYGQRKHHHYNFGDLTIETTDKYKYLGTTLTHTGNFKTNQNLLKKKGLRAAYLILKGIGKNSKVSTAIKIYEKIIEPILTYNCEVTEAFMPDGWKYDKFKTKIWDTGHELNKTNLSFIRQILGVHKKTTNIALLAETGKFPICVKIFSHIIKYWLRIKTTEKTFLKEAHKMNEVNFSSGKRSWMKMINFLTKYTEIDKTKPIHIKSINKMTKTFKHKISLKYRDWWTQQAQVTGSNKLDFYYQFKRNFVFEKYLDNIPRNIRIPITRIRLSCHPFPVETGRYASPKIQRKDRLCKICHLQNIGDELHYLCQCKNVILEKIRNKFITDIKSKCPKLAPLSMENIINYCLTLHDPDTQLPMAMYAKEITDSFKNITNLQTKPITCVITRYGRQTKAPVRLDL